MRPSSTVITPFLPTLVKALASTSPMVRVVVAGDGGDLLDLALALSRRLELGELA